MTKINLIFTFSKGNYENASEMYHFRLPFILSLPYDWLRFPEAIKRIDLYDASHKADVILYIAHNISSCSMRYSGDCLSLASACACLAALRSASRWS